MWRVATSIAVLLTEYPLLSLSLGTLLQEK
jgi:hypothetical protein